MNETPTRFDELLDSLVDGHLSPAERAELDALCMADEALAERRREEEQLVAVLRALPRPAAPPDLLSSALAKAKVVEVAPPAASRWNARLLSIAAVSVLALCGSLVAWQTSRKGSVPETSSNVAFTETARDEGTVSVSTFSTGSDADARKNEVVADVKEDVVAPAMTGSLLPEAKLVESPAEPPAPAASPAQETFESVDAEADSLGFAKRSLGTGHSVALSQEVLLPTLDEVRPLLSRNGGKVVADTPYLAAANAVMEGREPAERTGETPETRYLVVEAPGNMDAFSREVEALPVPGRRQAIGGGKGGALEKQQATIAVTEMLEKNTVSRDRIVVAYRDVPKRPATKKDAAANAKESKAKGRELSAMPAPRDLAWVESRASQLGGMAFEDRARPLRSDAPAPLSVGTRSAAAKPAEAQADKVETIPVELSFEFPRVEEALQFLDDLRQAFPAGGPVVPAKAELFLEGDRYRVIVPVAAP